MVIPFTEVLLCGIACAYVFAAPYTKVEESFNTQAMHDLLYEESSASFDHLTFPGVVPRSFVGAIVVSSLARPFLWAGLGRTAMLLVVRLLLAMLNIGPLLALGRRLGKTERTFFLLLTCSQFHLLFYISRPLPNIFALILVLWSQVLMLDNKWLLALMLQASCTVVFRCDVLLLCGTTALVGLWTKRVTFLRLLGYGIATGAANLALTVLVDSFFWKRWVWPEGEVLFFNTVENRSSEWGTSPFLWYFYSALPRACLCALPLAIVGSLLLARRSMAAADATRSGMALLGLPFAMFVLLYSTLPHKELRFIMYAVPVVNIVAAGACAHFWKMLSERKRLRWALAGLLLACNAVLCAMFLVGSIHNYPGGEALARLHAMGKDKRCEPPAAGFRVHIDVAAAQSGISRFLEHRSSGWEYSKDENVDAGGYGAYTHLVTGDPSSHEEEFDIVWTQFGFSGLQRNWRLFRFSPKIFVMQRKDILHGPCDVNPARARARTLRDDGVSVSDSSDL